MRDDLRAAQAGVGTKKQRPDAHALVGIGQGLGDVALGHRGVGLGQGGQGIASHLGRRVFELLDEHGRSLGPGAVLHAGEEKVGGFFLLDPLVERAQGCRHAARLHLGQHPGPGLAQLGLALRDYRGYRVCGGVFALCQ